MAQRKRVNVKKQKKRSGPPSYATTSASLEYQPPPRPVDYGKAFIIMEDRAKNTFIYTGSSWVPHTMSIAECRENCQVKELPQKLNDKTRYEVREPIY